MSSTSTVKINNFRRFTETQEDVKSEDIEIFPGKMVAFVVKGLPPRFIKYRLPGHFPWIDITEKDKFFSLELVAGEGVDPPRLAGTVEIILGGSSQSFSFGDHVNGEYLEFDATNYDLAAKLVHVKLTDA